MLLGTAAAAALGVEVQLNEEDDDDGGGDRGDGDDGDDDDDDDVLMASLGTSQPLPDPADLDHGHEVEGVTVSGGAGGGMSDSDDFDKAPRPLGAEEDAPFASQLLAGYDDAGDDMDDGGCKCSLDTRLGTLSAVQATMLLNAFPHGEHTWPASRLPPPCPVTPVWLLSQQSMLQPSAPLQPHSDNHHVASALITDQMFCTLSWGLQCAPCPYHTM